MAKRTGKPAATAIPDDEAHWPAYSVERVPIAELIPAARNPRTHTPEQIKQIAASIVEFGWTMAVLRDEDGGLIAGHGRILAAADELGLTHAPVITARGWTDAQKRAYVIADNKLTLNGGWDDNLLAAELGALDELGFDLELTGFSADELTLMTAENDGPAPEQPTEGGGETNFVIQYNIIFDSEEQQAFWYSFVKFLKTQYADAETLGERLQIFIRNNGYVAG